MFSKQLTASGFALLGGLACGVNVDERGAEREPSGPDAVPEPERPPVGPLEGSTSNEPKSWTLYAFSETLDIDPTTISVTSEQSYRECSIRMPGNEPMTMSEHWDEIECSTGPLGPDGLVLSVSYPSFKALSPRTEESSLKPGPRPAPPPTICNGSVCKTSFTGATAYDPTPDFPHVVIQIASGVGQGEVEVSFTGNGRDVTIPIVLEDYEVSEMPYVNVDAPPSE